MDKATNVGTMPDQPERHDFAPFRFRASPMRCLNAIFYPTPW